ncbi:MAG: hypothetical protein D6758_03855 [Gammaproteobacteria bacterium]|nr:MAG: hypothetical protein D6758_03855 [Gammaproteobacteria bacterium]
MTHTVDVHDDHLIELIRDSLASEQLQPRTVNTYTHWIERFLWLNQDKPIERLTEEDAKGFLSYVRQRLKASRAKQKQAMSALEYFFSVVRPRLHARTTDSSEENMSA